MAYQSMEQFNKQFQAKNPQYFTKPEPTPTVKPVPQYQPMGTPAIAPQDNTQAPARTIPANQAKTGIATPPPRPDLNSSQQSASYPGIVGNIANMSQYGSPEVQKSTKDISDFERGVARKSAERGLLFNPFGYVGSLDSLAENRASQERNALQTAKSNALTEQAQRLSGLGTAAGYAAPIQAPFTNDIINPQGVGGSGGGTRDPFTGGTKMARYSQGQDYQNSIPLIESAAGYTNNVINLLNSGGFNQSDLNIQNLLNNTISSNTSNPNFAKLQSNFRTAIDNYAQVLGQSPESLISSLTASGKATTVGEALRNIDSMAREFNEKKKTLAPTAVQPSTTAGAGIQTSGQTSGGNTYEIIP